MADRPIWKREIRLRRRSEPGAPSSDSRSGGKDAPVEAVAAEPVQPTLDQPSLWDSPSPDSPFAMHEPVAERSPVPVEPDQVTPSPDTRSSDTEAQGWFSAPSEDRTPTGESSQPAASVGSVTENAPAASGPSYTSKREWAAESEHVSPDLVQAEPEATAEGTYGFADSPDERWEMLASTIPPSDWSPPDRSDDAGAPVPPAVPTPEADAGLAPEPIVGFKAEAIELQKSEPASTRWWDSEPNADETPGAAETEPSPASREPEPVRTWAEPTDWLQPEPPDAPPTENEQPVAERERELIAPPLGPAEQVEPAAAGRWRQEEHEPESEASPAPEDAEPEWQTSQEVEPLPPLQGWEPALGTPESDTPDEPAESVPATPVARLEAPRQEKPKPGLLKRELSLPRSLRRAPKPRSPKTPDAHAIKNIVGLRVGSSQLAAAHVHNNGAAELVQIARAPLARGIVAGGEVRDSEALTSALKKFFSEHKLPRRGIRLGIASNRIGVRILEVPVLDDPRLFENSIRFHAQETLPISVSDAIIDHVVLGPGAGGGLEPMVRILLVFAHRELVDRHVQACRRAGLKLEGIDFEAFALLRALGAPRPAETEPTRAVVAVAIGQERTIFAVSDGRICDFTRVLEWGGGSLDVSIARALNLTPSQAEPLKLGLSLDGDAAPSHVTAEQATTARAAIRTELQSLSRELVSSLQFYQARPGSLDIGEIMLSGGGAQLDGLAAELEHLVGVPVVTGDPFARVHVGRKVTASDESGSFAIAIGLGIED